ncbi:hypothetical protein V6N13_090298 [Hibiscus sabdariffa]
MEATKLSCFLTKFKANADKIVRTMESLEAQVRECYEEASDHLNSQEFVEMMVYDACFIVQLIRGDFVPDIFKERGIRDEIVNDLLLFENQLPFFVISELYHIIMERDVHQLARDALSLFHSVDVPVPNKDFKHLLDLVYSCHRPSARGITQPRDFRGSIEFIGSATELDNAGIDFFGVTPEKIKDPKQGIETMFDIMFTQDRVLRIPTLMVDDWTELNFRNYIVYEQFIPSGEPTYYFDYVLFMDYLINTSRDVELLRKKRIINNCLGQSSCLNVQQASGLRRHRR